MKIIMFVGWLIETLIQFRDWLQKRRDLIRLFEEVVTLLKNRRPRMAASALITNLTTEELTDLSREIGELVERRRLSMINPSAKP